MDKNIIKIDGDDTFIAIPFREYKELLIIKGKYEEVKAKMNSVPWTVTPLKTNITYQTPQWEPEERKVTCCKK